MMQRVKELWLTLKKRTGEAMHTISQFVARVFRRT
jgi:hypothetical protein